MNLNKLLLNPSKTEFLLIGTKQQRLKFSDLTNLSLSNDIIPVSSSAHNLGFIFDSDMSFSDQINSVSKSCHFHIRDIRRIYHLLPLSTATALANSLVSSKLDYCNSLYSGISQTNLNKLQRIQNSLARVLTNTSSTFELLVCSLRSASVSVIHVVIYRPGSEPVTEKFFSELTGLLEIVAAFRSRIVISGDFNIHVNDAGDRHDQHLIELINSFDLVQHVNQPTHSAGNTLDLVITQSDLPPDICYVELYRITAWLYAGFHLFHLRQRASLGLFGTGRSLV